MRRSHLSFSFRAISLLLCIISAQSYSQTLPDKEDLHQATPHTTKTTTKDTPLSGKNDGGDLQQVSPMAIQLPGGGGGDTGGGSGGSASELPVNNDIPALFGGSREYLWRVRFW
ncbi:hypothetical protein CWE25_13575 [Idiomarina fontislapidosi]|uniref:Uncharacterized protein n=1 Tax=Idiomarina fontislapidosi TaxID=263723 RepID=A0A432XB85_9GAMM|nr:hypothetical protein [Idiomarina fontislapidosi]RUO45955.1 hypothetical protein CWE25_13575 [Idiomarina fontislapidosi]